MLLSLAALLPIVNPLGAAPVYLAKTVDLTPAEHKELSGRVAINSFMLLLASLFVGGYVQHLLTCAERLLARCRAALAAGQFAALLDEIEQTCSDALARSAARGAASASA